jgi:GNAT superfamily N-acetyltransferase
MTTLPLLPTSLTFAPVTHADFEELLALRIEAMRDSLERIGRFDLTRARERFQASFDPDYTSRLVVDGICIGFVTVRPQETGLLLDHLYLRPATQGRGIGSMVLEKIFREADAAGMVLRVGALRGSGANRFYLRHGFEQIDESEWDIYYLRRPKAAAAGC